MWEYRLRHKYKQGRCGRGLGPGEMGKGRDQLRDQHGRALHGNNAEIVTRETFRLSAGLRLGWAIKPDRSCSLMP